MSSCDFCNYETDLEDDPWFDTFEAISYGPVDERGTRTLCGFCGWAQAASRHRRPSESDSIVKDVASMLNVFRAESLEGDTE